MSIIINYSAQQRTGNPCERNVIYEVEGAELVGFAEVQAKYESSFVMTLDEVKEAIFNRLDELDAKEMTQQADDVLLTYLDSPDDIEKLTSKQMQTAQSILDDLDALLGE